MSGGSLAQLPRLLALVPYLLQHPGVQSAEAAALFGVTDEQLRRDLNLIWLCGLPGHGPGDLIDLEFEGDTITLLEPAGVTRPLRLGVDEALALLVALRTLSETPGLADRDVVERTLAKVEEAAGAAASPAQRVEVALEGEERVLPVVRDALDRRRRLHLSYYVPGRDETTERDVDPMRLLLVEGRSYLEAWCRRVEGVRLFRLDRVVAIEVLDLPAEPPPTATERDLSRGLFQPSPDDVLVVLALGPGAHWVADYYPCESVEDVGDGTVVARLRTPEPSWIVRLALGLGASARVIEPPELAAEVRSAARNALAAYAV
ncbi:MAG: proteasome accessory factor [Actinomycetota bacterium]|jgi:proteasome accessory factor C|nr:proteasome accessory factor [Actinomycetota bacterium]